MERLPMVLHVFSAAEEGQDLIEYGLLMALIAVFAVMAVTSLGQNINSVLWQLIAAAF